MSPSVGADTTVSPAWPTRPSQSSAKLPFTRAIAPRMRGWFRLPAGTCLLNTPALRPSTWRSITDAGLFDVSHMGQIEVAGKNAAAAVDRLICSDASALSIGQVNTAVC